MQTKDINSKISPMSSGAAGRVQWVNPRPARLRRDGQAPRNGNKKRSPRDRGVINKNYSPTSSSCDNYNSNNTSTPSTPDADESSPFLDANTCRTICIIVEEYLKELREHQKSINLTRSQLINGNHLSEDSNCIAHNDVSRLKVRDEQTKAIETIKQLTNYLRELSYLNTLTNEPHDGNSELETIQRLADVRINIVQALNDFVLLNSDIDIPIMDAEDSNCQDYDLCLDASTSPSDKIRDHSSKNDDSMQSSPRHDYSIDSHQNSIVVVDIRDSPHKLLQQRQLASDARFVVLERRKKEIEKLERDTVELRRLFSDFYSLVKMQSEPIDSIEENIVIATQRISESHNNINRTMKSLTILMPFTGCMAGALIGGPIGFFVGGKLGGVTIVCATSLLGFISSYSAQKCITVKKVKRD